MQTTGNETRMEFFLGRGAECELTISMPIVDYLVFLSPDLREQTENHQKVHEFPAFRRSRERKLSTSDKLDERWFACS